MYIKINEELKELVNEKAKPEKRDCFTELISSINKENEKISILFGLRRTGKTVLMHQAMKELGIDNCLYIYCEKAKKNYKTGELRFDCLSDIVETIAKFPQKYIFIDEATRLIDFVKTSSVLPDLIASKNKRIIVSGTESLGFILAKKDGELLDRAELIRTSYIPFHEWNRILDKPLEEYIKYGGTMSPEGTFYNDDDCIEYLDTAIVNNFLLPLEYLGRKDSPVKLYDAFANNELATYIQIMIDMSNEKFMICDETDLQYLDDFEYLKDDFQSSNILGDLRDIIGSRMVETNISNKVLYEKEQEIVQTFRKALRIHTKSEILDTHLDKDLLRELKYYMEKMDMIAPKDQSRESYYFVQPGLRYSQCRMLIDSLTDVGIDKKYSKADWLNILEMFKTITYGRLLEDIVFSDIARHEAAAFNLDICKYRRDEQKKNEKTPIVTGEFDIVLTDFIRRESVLFEVKNSLKAVEEQTKHLKSAAFCKQFEEEFGTKIVKKIVIYNGPTQSAFHVDYINATEFLLRSIGRNRIINKTPKSDDYKNVEILSLFQEILPLKQETKIKENKSDSISNETNEAGTIKAAVRQDTEPEEKDEQEERE